MVNGCARMLRSGLKPIEKGHINSTGRGNETNPAVDQIAMEIRDDMSDAVSIFDSHAADLYNMEADWDAKSDDSQYSVQRHIVPGTSGTTQPMNQSGVD